MSTEKSPAMSNEAANTRPPLALIAGPTASGKSDVAVKIALSLQATGKRAVVINADSAQVYRDLELLSARPTQQEMRGIEHRLFGAWDGATPCSAADWANAARAEIAKCHQSGAVPILVGGTGLYLRTLLDGIAPIPAIDPEIRAQVRGLPVSETYPALIREDPHRAAALAPADTARIARALEVIRSTGKPMAWWQERREGGIGNQVDLKPAILLPDRDALYERCDRRFALMLNHGAIHEVETLLARGLDPALPVMRAIGVCEVAGYLQGKWTLDEALARGSQATRNYAKRQFTWFRRQPPESWLRHEYDDFSSGPLSEIILRHSGLT